MLTWHNNCISKTFLCRSLAGDEKQGYFTFPTVDIQTELPKPKPVKNYILPPIENGLESSLGAQDPKLNT